jgi:hypothetical protein
MRSILFLGRENPRVNFGLDRSVRIANDPAHPFSVRGQLASYGTNVLGAILNTGPPGKIFRY